MMVRLHKVLQKVSEKQFLNVVTENIFSINLSEHLYPDHFSFDYINMYSDFSWIVGDIEFFDN